MESEWHTYGVQMACLRCLTNMLVKRKPPLCVAEEAALGEIIAAILLSIGEKEYFCTLINDGKTGALKCVQMPFDAQWVQCLAFCSVL